MRNKRIQNNINKIKLMNLKNNLNIFNNKKITFYKKWNNKINNSSNIIQKYRPNYAIFNRNNYKTK